MTAEQLTQRETEVIWAAKVIGRAGLPVRLLRYSNAAEFVLAVSAFLYGRETAKRAIKWRKVC